MKDFDWELLDGSIDVAFVRGNYTGSPVSRDTWLLYPQNKHLNENVERFVDFILRQLRTIASATGSGSFSPAVCQNTSEASTR